MDGGTRTGRGILLFDWTSGRNECKPLHARDDHVSSFRDLRTISFGVVPSCTIEALTQPRLDTTMRLAKVDSEWKVGVNGSVWQRQG
ncbi:hypothetical protein C5E16_03365 [Clavibacter michiganensis]|uniref:Uncharacterized protein n=1 Tax=Clavibacter michiganensis TaxID=28447 RepID=A0A2S5VW60_9MICO|nr:hypothetical protein [Clavibacter michiganensis]PPF69964.1 hypothetical protein C5E16_03365 [Clavibacter michiganensis]